MQLWPSWCCGWGGQSAFSGTILGVGADACHGLGLELPSGTDREPCVDLAWVLRYLAMGAGSLSQTPLPKPAPVGGGAGRPPRDMGQRTGSGWAQGAETNRTGAPAPDPNQRIHGVGSSTGPHLWSVVPFAPLAVTTSSELLHKGQGAQGGAAPWVLGSQVGSAHPQLHRWSWPCWVGGQPWHMHRPCLVPGHRAAWGRGPHQRECREVGGTPHRSKSQPQQFQGALDNSPYLGFSICEMGTEAAGRATLSVPGTQPHPRGYAQRRAHPSLRR